MLDIKLRDFLSTAVSPSLTLSRSKKATYLLLRTAARLSSFHRKAKRLAFKAVLRCKGGDLSVVVPIASRRPLTLSCLRVGRVAHFLQ